MASLFELAVDLFFTLCCVVLHTLYVELMTNVHLICGITHVKCHTLQEPKDKQLFFGFFFRLNLHFAFRINILFCVEYYLYHSLNILLQKLLSQPDMVFSVLGIQSHAVVDVNPAELKQNETITDSFSCCLTLCELYDDNVHYGYFLFSLGVKYTRKH